MNPVQADDLIPRSLQWLDGRINRERNLGIPRPTLKRMQSILRVMGEPHHRYPVVHVTGTNGKTSTSRLIAHLLTASGLRTGCYTSPHLSRVNERMLCDGTAVTDGDLMQHLDTVREADAVLVQSDPGHGASYFEAITAAAFNWFAECHVDVAVIEVGLGGTWDATNVVDASVAVVTNVSVDHIEYLGHDVSSIAAEKAGIIKPTSTLLLGETAPGITEIFLGRRAARVFRSGSDFGVVERRQHPHHQVLDLVTPKAVHAGLVVPVAGSFHAANTGLAVVAAEAFLDAAPATETLNEALASFRAPGRMEIVHREPLMLVDGAHNVGGARALMKALRRDFPNDHRSLVVGVLVDKDALGILQSLNAGEADQIFVCALPNPRSHDPERLAEIALAAGVHRARLHECSSLEAGIRAALSHTPTSGQIVVTGSLSAVAEAHRILEKLDASPCS